MSATLEQELVSTERTVPMRRVWAMASKNTFDIPPFRALVRQYLNTSKVSIDPFARNKRWATYTNDLNPDTAAEYHMSALEFLNLMVEREVKADLVLFDPPYSRRQVMEVYNGIGKDYRQGDSQYHSLNWPAERKRVERLLVPGGFVISFGWQSNGMNQCGSLSGSFAIVEILLVAHGGAHNDTICVVERKVENTQPGLFINQRTSETHGSEVIL